MLIQSVGAILLFSDEPERLVAFYRQTFGLELEEENHGGASLHWGCEIGQTHFAIHSSRLNRGQRGVAFSLTAPNLEDVLGELNQRSIRTEHRPIAMGDGARRVSVKDADGNTISLVEPAKSWKNE